MSSEELRDSVIAHIDNLLELPSERLVAFMYVDPDNLNCRCAIGHMLNKVGIERVMTLGQNKISALDILFKPYMFKKRFRGLCENKELLYDIQNFFDIRYEYLYKEPPFKNSKTDFEVLKDLISDYFSDSRE